MSQTLTGLIPTIRVALDTVAREQVGAIQSVAKNTSGDRAAIGQSITFPVTENGGVIDVVAGVTAPVGTDVTVPNSMSITKSKGKPITWNGEEQMSVSQFGQYNTILADQFAQAFRDIGNEINTDIISTAREGASFAVGTAGTTPFGTANNLTDFSNSENALDDRGAPQSDRRMILSGSAMGNLKGIQSSLWKANEAGTDELLRRGILNMVEGFGLAKSQGMTVHTKGDAASATTDDTGYPIGSTTITLASAGTGAILSEDSVSFAGDANVYQVLTGDADVSGGGTIVLPEPGLLVAIPASATAITVGDSYTPNIVFQRPAIVLMTRAPAMPLGGDGATDTMTFKDEFTGLVYEVSVYRQFRQVTYFVSIAWGTKAVKTNFIGMLRG